MNSHTRPAEREDRRALTASEMRVVAGELAGRGWTEREIAGSLRLGVVDVRRLLSRRRQ